MTTTHDLSAHAAPCRFYARGYCRYGTTCTFSHDDSRLDAMTNVHQKTNPVVSCRFYARGYCRYGETCTFSHDVDHQWTPFAATPDTGTNEQVSSRIRGEIPCRAWKAGSCWRGSQCWFAHDPQAHLDEQRAAQETERRVRMTEIAKQEAAKTVKYIVFGSIVMFGAGLTISNFVTGFESCTIRVKNLPPDAREDEVRELFTQQGIDPAYFHIISMKKWLDGRQEAIIVIQAEYGQVLAVGLKGIEFRDETLAFEVHGYNSPGSMSETAGRDADVLTISWHGPSSCYVVEYPDIPEASRKVEELDGKICSGRRVKVEMNFLPPGRVVKSFRPNSVRISRLPSQVSDEVVRVFSGSHQVRLLKGPAYDLGAAVQMLLEDINRLVPGALRTLEQTSQTDSVDGVITFRAQFTSWEEAQKVHDGLANQKCAYIGNWFFLLRLPSPMLYTIIIPVEQYKAQKTGWDTLQESIKDKKACCLVIHEEESTVRIRVSGAVKQAIGALKVRVENLMAGEKVDGWHSSLFGTSGSTFVHSVFDQTGAFLRADWTRQVLKIYGQSSAVQDARALVKAELERLSSMERTVTLKRQSISFFIRHGIPALKETFGEDSVKFDASSRQVIITGGEEARHALKRLIDESLSDLPERPPVGQACPICYDEISSPFHLGCGHSYCMACLRHFLTSAVDSDHFPLLCVGDDAQCRVPIAIPTIQRFLPPSSFKRLLEVVFVTHVARHPQDLKFCKTPDCTQIYRAAERDAATVIQCPSCFLAICASCHEDAHEGMSCAENRIHKDPAEQDRLNNEWISQQGGRVKKCPSCSIPIEKVEGCNHMSCRCGVHICWQCMGIFTVDTIYTHMNDQHGGVYQIGDLPDFD